MGKNTIRRVDAAKQKAEKGFRRVRMALAGVAQLAEVEYGRRIAAEQVLAEIERILGENGKTEGTLADRVRTLAAQGDQLCMVIGKAKEETHAQWHRVLRDSGIAVTCRDPVGVVELLKNREANVLCVAKEGCARIAEDTACSECRTNVGNAVRDRILSDEKETVQ